MKRIAQMKNLYIKSCKHLAAVALFCFSGLSIHAQNTVTYDHVVYSLQNSTRTATVTGVDSRGIKAVVIADEVANTRGDRFSVVKVGASAFYNCSNLANVSFGANLTEIGESAFAGCAALKRVVVAEGVATIKNYAFQNTSLQYAELPSTLRGLGSGVFKSNKHDLDTLVLHTAYPDASGEIVGLDFITSAFNSSYAMRKCTLMVPKKAYEWYANETGINWGTYFQNIIAFGAPPKGFDVVPEELQSYRDLSDVAVTFTFDDETQSDLFSLEEGDAVEASLILSDGTSLPADDFHLEGNTFRFDFGEVLQTNRDLFIATSEEVTTMDVQLRVTGLARVEECPFDVTAYFAKHPISWSVPLLPSVYDLPAAPAVLLSGEAQDECHDYRAFETVTLRFDDYTDISLDETTGAYLRARIYKDGELLCSSEEASVTGDNTVALAFDVPLDQLLVRRTSGVESYVFTLVAEGQINMNDGEEEKNFRFTLPFSDTESSPAWQVQAVYIPEPTTVSVLPAEGTVALTDLTDVVLTFEGVEGVTLSDEISDALTASLLINGEEILSIDAEKVSVADNTLHLLFDPIDERRITLITADKDFGYDITLRLAAHLLTDGYPCCVVIGDGSSPEASYTQRWDTPQWEVPAIVHDVPALTLSSPEAVEGEIITHDQLKVIEIEVDNYETVTLPSADDTGSHASAFESHLLRDGSSVCVTGSVEVQGNKIIIDFGERMDQTLVGITPDDDPEIPVELSFSCEGDLLFDGMPYHLVYDSSAEGVTWSVRPVVIYKLPVPTIEYVNGRLYFTSGVEGVEYHYSISNSDAVGQTTSEAVKGSAGSSLSLPLQKTYIITVYATREGYEDSEEATAILTLGSAPTVLEQ